MNGNATTEFEPGTVLAGKYRVERVIGQGGMGVVVEARHIALDERVALKFLLPAFASHPEAPERFLREAKAAVKIKSSHVARVSDVGTLESGSPYMVMEYLEGTDAAHLVEGGRVLPVAEAVDLIVQACDAISDAHAQGIVHRDLKPANLFVARHSDGSPFVKVLDFGISKIVDQGRADLTRTNATLGSALYMSPEQIRQSKSVDRRTDIYALGITLYEFLTGRHPFNADTFPALCVEIVTGTPTAIRQLRPDLPPQLSAVVQQAIARELTDRYQSVAELVVALSPWVPPRSQPIVERIARAAGLRPREPVVQAGPPSVSTSAMGQGGLPVSTRLDAAATQGHPLTSSGRSWPIAVAILVVVLGAGAALFLRKGGDTGSSSQSTSTGAVAPAPSPPAPPEPAHPSPEMAVAPVAAPPPSPSAMAVPGDGKLKPAKPPDSKRPSKPAPRTSHPSASPPSAPTPTRGADEYR